MRQNTSACTAMMAAVTIGLGSYGCGSSSDTQSSGAGGSAGAGGAGGSTAGVMYSACPESYRSECATLQVPLDHAQPDGESIDLHIARDPASGEAKRQLWLLSGGPGQGGYIFYELVELLRDQLPDTDIFVVDHRGTGYSHRLSCPQQDVPNSSGG